MFVTEERTDWMERGRRRATRHHQIYPVYRTPRRRRRRRRCGEAEHLVRNMWHLVEPNDHDRSGRRAGKTPSSALFTLLLSVLLVTSSSALSSSAFRTLESSHHRIARSAAETGEAYGPLREKESNHLSDTSFYCFTQALPVCSMRRRRGFPSRK